MLRISHNGTIGDYFANVLKNLNSKIDSETDDYILNVGVAQYAEYLKNEYSVELGDVYPDNLEVSTHEKQIAGRYFPIGFDIIDPDKTFPRNVFVYHLPYQGNVSLLGYRNDIFSGRHRFELNKQNSSIDFSYVKFYDDPEIIKRDFNSDLQHFLQFYEGFKKKVNSFNETLERKALQKINERKKLLLKRDDFMGSLGVPIKRKENTSGTYSIPKPTLKKEIKVKPKVSEKGYQPEPSIDDNVYQQILKIINDTGKNIERMPSIYNNNEEEHLRDHFIMNLDPKFEYGSVTGETFNKTGKTDIQIRYDSSVVFVAECKFWHGEKGLSKTIDQLLKYLTWRDSRTSMVVFVKNRAFQDLLNKGRRAIEDHPQFVAKKPDSDENWFNYIFSLPDESNKEIKLAVQFFHFPNI